MKSENTEMLPDEIRRIRVSLGLTQVEAGELLGGGPRAFSKYEAGTIRPTAGVATLLRVLDTNPRAIETLTGRRTTPITSEDLKPFEIAAGHVSALNARKFVSLISRTLNAEALNGGLPRLGLHVSSNITAPDGGEDGRIEWLGPPSKTEFLPCSKCVFQMKATKVSPAQAANEVGDVQGGLKAMVKDVLENGGAFIIASNQSYTKQQIDARKKAMRDRVTLLGLTITEDQLDFRDADGLAVWINALPTVAVWLLGQTQPGLTGPFRDWSHSAARTEHDNSTWIDDSRFGGFLEKLRASVSVPKQTCRVIGQSGVGKSRLTLEALGPVDDEEESAVGYRDIVLFASASDTDSVAIKNALQVLVDTRTRAIVVVDECDLSLHNDLDGIVGRSSSRLSLVTIDNHYTDDEKSYSGRIFLGTSSDSVVEGILRSRIPALADEDRRRLIKFSGGYPRIAHLLSDAWLNDIPVAAASDESLVHKVVLGRSSISPTRVLIAAQLLGVFKILGFDDELAKDLDDVAHLSTLSAADLRIGLAELRKRDVVQMKGRFATLQPKPVALAVAATQWQEWTPDIWDHVLVGDLKAPLRLRAAKQLALLDTKSISRKVTGYVCRPTGPLDSLEGLSRDGNAEVLSSLAEIDAEAVADLLQRVLAPLTSEELIRVAGDTRRHLVWALEKIAFLKATFEAGAELLLQLAMAENESISNNSEGQFKALFPGLLADTEADPDLRLKFLDGELERNDPERLSIIAEALLSGAQTNHFSRTVGSESHGSRAALQPWQPKTWNEAWDYVRQCADRLVVLSRRSDEIGAKAKRGLGHELRSYVGKNLLGDVERWVRAVHADNEYWPEAITSLGDILQYDADGMDDDEVSRVRSLIDELTPSSITDRLKFIVTEMPWDYPCDERLEYEERGRRQSIAVEDLATELLEEWPTLLSHLPALSSGEQRQSTLFGEFLIKGSSDPVGLLREIERVYLEIPVDERNHGLLSGAVAAMKSVNRDVHDDFKRRASKSRELAKTLPFTCLRSGIEDEDMDLVIDAIKCADLEAAYLQNWMLGGELSKLSPGAVEPLFRCLIEMGGKYYVVCIDILGMFVHQRYQLLEEFKPLIILAANGIHNFGDRYQHSTEAHHFETIALWLLNKGEEDEDARKLATLFAQKLAEDPSGPGIEVIKKLLRKLLEKFPLIVWPYLGRAISGTAEKRWGLEEALSDRFTFDRDQTPAILSIPEEFLFAWCGANEETAPAFLGSVLPVLASRDASSEKRAFHPWMKRLIDLYGNRSDVQSAISSNMHTYGWTGSMTTYYALYQPPFQDLQDAQNPDTRRWAKRILTSLKKNIDRESYRDDEDGAQWS